MRRLVLPVFGLLVLSACVEEDKAPVPPDLSGLKARYGLVTGTLDPETAPELIQATAEKLGYLGDATAMLELALGALDGIQAGGQQPGGEIVIEEGLSQRQDGLGQGDITFEAGAWGVYTRRCPGWPGTTDRGRLRMTALFKTGGLEPVLWGAFRDCRVAAADGEGRLRFKGAIALELDGLSLGLLGGETGGITSVLARFGGEIERDGETTALDFDLSIVPGVAILTAVTLANGDSFLVGYGIGDSGVRVVDGRGLWQCGATRCQGPQGLQVRF